MALAGAVMSWLALLATVSVTALAGFLLGMAAAWLWFGRNRVPVDGFAVRGL